nr:hypothetical protein [Bacteroidota bacterium]
MSSFYGPQNNLKTLSNPIKIKQVNPLSYIFTIVLLPLIILIFSCNNQQIKKNPYDLEIVDSYDG